MDENISNTPQDSGTNDREAIQQSDGWFSSYGPMTML